MKYLKIFTILSIIFILNSCGSDDENKLPSISIESIQVEEGNTTNNLEVMLTLTKAVDFDVSLEARTIDGTAIKGEDYTDLHEVIIFTAGQEQLSINIEILGEQVPEDNEIFSVRLEDPFNVKIATSTATITLINDDEHFFTIPENGYSTPETYEGMTLVWSDEFDGPNINSNNWTFEIGTGNGGWGNNELQYYQEANTSIIDGNLVVEARRETIGSSSYTSSRLITKDKQSFQYGRVDIRAVMPKGQGLWPALWMLGSNFSQVGWPACGEIDIMEMKGGENSDNLVYGTAHWEQGGHVFYGQTITNDSGKLSEDYHVYSLIWDEESISWFFDDINYNSVDINPDALSAFREEFFIILNIAVGGDFPGSPDNTTIFPQWMIIDYIRVFL